MRQPQRWASSLGIKTHEGGTLRLHAGNAPAQVRPIAEDEMFKVLRTGKRMKKSWKRMITKATFVGQGFTRKPPKYERFIRPTGMRFTKAHTTHPELKVCN
jgi:ribosomal protein S8E